MASFVKMMGGVRCIWFIAYCAVSCSIIATEVSRRIDLLETILGSWTMLRTALSMGLLVKRLVLQLGWEVWNSSPPLKSRGTKISGRSLSSH